MTCPLCTAALDRTTLLASGDAPELRGFACPNGHGTFLPSDLYFAWREGREPSDASGALPASEAVGDVKQAKLCPQDGRIMRRYRTDAEGFWLDRCSTCGGVWFDGDEWDATVEAGLVERLGAIFSDAWQRNVEEALTAQRWDDKLEAEIGADDLARIDAFRAWAWEHPQRHLVFARVQERPASGAEE